MMDAELKRYLDEITVSIAVALEQMESRIMSALKSPEARLDPVARKLEGEEEDKSDPDVARIEAGH